MTSDLQLLVRCLTPHFFAIEMFYNINTFGIIIWRHMTAWRQISIKIHPLFRSSVNSIIQTKVINDSVFLSFSTRMYWNLNIISDLQIRSPPNFHKKSVLIFINLMLQNFQRWGDRFHQSLSSPRFLPSPCSIAMRRDTELRLRFHLRTFQTLHMMW